MAQVNTAVDFKSMLAKPVESAERPKPKPGGTYNAIIEGYKFDTSREKKTPYCRLTYSNLTPGDDVDAQQLQDSGADLSKWKPHSDFYLTEDALYRFREVIESCGINVAGRSFNETIPELKGKPVILTVTAENRTDERTGEPYIRNEIAVVRGA